MSINAWHFKPREIRRAIKAVQMAGLAVSQVEVGRDGQIIVNVRQPAPMAQQVVADADAHPR